MRFLVGVLSAAGAGLLIGTGLGIILTEDKFRKEYQESAESMRRAMELARVINAEVMAPVETEVELENETKEDEGLVLVSPAVIEEKNDLPFDPAAGLVEVNDFTPQETNPYHVAVAGVQEDPTFALIEEEDYLDHHDGRSKGQITITMEEHNPIFFEGGMQIKDWDVKIGDNILRDFYTKCPPGKEQVLFVRNNLTDTDYEVIREQP